MAIRKNILIIDRNDAHYELVCSALKVTPLKPVLFRATDAEKGASLLKSRRFDLILTENGHTGEDSSWFDSLRDKAHGAAIVVLTSIADEKKAITAMKMGADDYIIKSRDSLKQLDQILLKAMESHKKRERSHSAPPTGLNLLARNLKVISEYINSPSKGIAEGKKKIRRLESELDNLKGMLKKLMS